MRDRPRRRPRGVKAACLADIDPEQQHGDLSIAAGSIYSGIILGAAAE
ncbi:hypothetical protein [Nannocystis pusilla]|uniref:Uncharacterized protein n=1 Tax=Nannocystis pusilla TaxID=889268 RepID=A0ABS7U512_9BACT|nr:hypothetical protein [Nannocystis pusilla]MBZ5715650.1 hypothetical protein [Nannocystis pusilla]